MSVPSVGHTEEVITSEQPSSSSLQHIESPQPNKNGSVGLETESIEELQHNDIVLNSDNCIQKCEPAARISELNGVREPDSTSASKESDENDPELALYVFW